MNQNLTTHEGFPYVAVTIDCTELKAAFLNVDHIPTTVTFIEVDSGCDSHIYGALDQFEKAFDWGFPDARSLDYIHIFTAQVVPAP